MAANEVKPSFSLQYLLLTAIGAVIVSGIGLGISKAYETRPKRELTIVSSPAVNLINDQVIPKEKIEVEYFLKGKKRRKILSLFRRRFTIINTGNEGVDNLQIIATLDKGDGVQLIDFPAIRTKPKEVKDSIKKADGSNNRKHIWNVALLNRSERITFEYSAFSEKKADDVSFSITTRKKDWEPKHLNSEELFFSNNGGSLNPILIISNLIIGTVGLVLLLSFPLYYSQWRRRSDYREEYVTFWRFWWLHSPANLFSPTQKTADE